MIKLRDKHYYYIYDNINCLLDTYTRGLIPIILNDYFINKEWQKATSDNYTPFKLLKIVIENNKILVYEYWKNPETNQPQLIYTKDYKTTINITMTFNMCDDYLGNRLCYIN